MSVYSLNALFTETLKAASNNTYTASNVYASTCNLANFASNLTGTTSNALQQVSVSTCNMFFSTSNSLYRQLNHSSNISVYSSNAHHALSNFYDPIGVYTSNLSVFSSNLAFTNSNFVISLSNELYPASATACNLAVFTSNTGSYTCNLANISSNSLYPLVMHFSCNNAVFSSNHAKTTSNMLVNNSNIIFTGGLFSSNAAVFASNASTHTSNSTLNYSNASFPIFLAQSNLAFFSSNASKHAVDKSLSSSNDLYARSVHSLTNAATSSNTSAWTAAYGQTLSNQLMSMTLFASNAARFSSNTSTATSNSLYPSAVFSSNVAVYTSNTTTSTSNQFYTSTSNSIHTGLTSASNAALFSSNLASTNSNALYPLQSFSAVTGVYASNTSAHVESKYAGTSNALYPLLFASSNRAVFTSNTAEFANNLTTVSSNYLYPSVASSSNFIVSASNATTWTSTAVNNASNILSPLVAFVTGTSTYASNLVSQTSGKIDVTSNFARSSGTEVTGSLHATSNLTYTYAAAVAAAASNGIVNMSNELMPSLKSSSNALGDLQNAIHYAQSNASLITNDIAGMLRASCNLADLQNVFAARSNLSLGECNDVIFGALSTRSIEIPWDSTAPQFSWQFQSNTGAQFTVDDSGRGIISLSAAGTTCLAVSAGLSTGTDKLVHAPSMLYINGRAGEAPPTVEIIAPVEFDRITAGAGAVSATVYTGSNTSHASMALQRQWSASLDAYGMTPVDVSSPSDAEITPAAVPEQQQIAAAAIPAGVAGGGCCVVTRTTSVFDAFNRESMVASNACSIIRYTSNGDVSWTARMQGRVAGWDVAAAGNHVVVVGEYETLYDPVTQQQVQALLYDAVGQSATSLTPSTISDSQDDSLKRRGFVIALDAGTGQFVRAVSVKGASIKTCAMTGSAVYVAGQHYASASAWSLAGGSNVLLQSLSAADGRSTSRASPCGFAAKLDSADLALHWCWGGADQTYISHCVFLPSNQLVLAGAHTSSNMPYFTNADGTVASNVGPMRSARSTLSAGPSRYVGLNLALNATTGSTNWVTFSDCLSSAQSSNITSRLYADPDAHRIYAAGWSAGPGARTFLADVSQSNESLCSLNFSADHKRATTVACYDANGVRQWVSGMVGSIVLPGSINVLQDDTARHILAVSGSFKAGSEIAPLEAGSNSTPDTVKWRHALSVGQPASLLDESWRGFVASLDVATGAAAAGGLVTSDALTRRAPLLAAAEKQAYGFSVPMLVPEGDDAAYMLRGAGMQGMSFDVTTDAPYRVPMRRPRAGSTSTSLDRLLVRRSAFVEVASDGSNTPLGGMRHVINAGSVPVLVASTHAEAARLFTPSSTTAPGATFTCVGAQNFLYKTV